MLKFGYVYDEVENGYIKHYILPDVNYNGFVFSGDKTYIFKFTKSSVRVYCVVYDMEIYCCSLYNVEQYIQYFGIKEKQNIRNYILDSIIKD